MWHKAKKVSLTSGQTDVKLDFPLPIVACNLMIEYADFYENMQVRFMTAVDSAATRRLYLSQVSNTDWNYYVSIGTDEIKVNNN